MFRYWADGEAPQLGHFPEDNSVQRRGLERCWLELLLLRALQVSASEGLPCLD
jgi:hypothetical protein